MIMVHITFYTAHSLWSNFCALFSNQTKHLDSYITKKPINKVGGTTCLSRICISPDCLLNFIQIGTDMIRPGSFVCQPLSVSTSLDGIQMMGCRKSSEN